ncbi:MAG: type II secretion system protein GspH [Candidatus Contendobacter odensis]|uniref:Type II secretion system protein H n=1 Tax=Candidatus Contendibacter odensensis TaxID=1400860 RepID=A0A2G6PFR2_9GAMM|nr:MAG: type II secretion system protein GspH [Candidatus Contendobacter odensis]
MMTVPMRGFTLLEIMVVMVLVGILASFAMLSAGMGSRERLAEEARRLAALVALHRQEAIIGGELHAIRFSDNAYAFLTLNQHGQWQSPETARALTQHKLPKDISLRLWVENRPADLRIADQPQVFLQNSGETTEFVAIFEPRDSVDPDAARYRVASDILGHMESGEVKP